MSSPFEQLDLSVLPPEYRAAFEAVAASNARTAEIIKRLEALVKELRHALHGKRSEKLTEDERQLAFEDLEIAVSEVETAKDALTPSATPREKRSSPNRISAICQRTCPGSKKLSSL